MTRRNGVRGELAGRVALVVGGGSGVGRAAAAALACEGARVAVADIDAAAAEDVAGLLEGGGLPVALDVTDPASVAAAFAKVGARLGAVDILVNAAAARERGSGFDTIAGMDLGRWDRAFQLNLHGALYCCRAAAPSMIERRWGRIVNIGSDAGFRLEPEAGAYAVSKAALTALTKVLARELVATGVTANVVAPHFTAEPPSRRRMRGRLSNALRYEPRSEDQAQAVLYLCKGSGQYVTGQTIHVNGGTWMP